MLTRCPACGTTVSLEVLIASESVRGVLERVEALSTPLLAAVVRYMALFRPATRALPMDRMGRLAEELLPLMEQGQVQRHGQSWEAPPEAWVWAIDQTMAARDAGRLRTPLTSHGWLLEVVTQWKKPASPTPGRQAGVLGFFQEAGHDHQ